MVLEFLLTPSSVYPQVRGYDLGLPERGLILHIRVFGKPSDFLILLAD
jgi:hypothetical protein